MTVPAVPVLGTSNETSVVRAGGQDLSRNHPACASSAGVISEQQNREKGPLRLSLLGEELQKPGWEAASLGMLLSRAQYRPAAFQGAKTAPSTPLDPFPYSPFASQGCHG